MPWIRVLTEVSTPILVIRDDWILASIRVAYVAGSCLVVIGCCFLMSDANGENKWDAGA